MLSTAQKLLSETTAHGFPRIFNAKTKSGRILWIIFTLGSFCGFMFHASTLLNQLIQNKAVVETLHNQETFKSPDLLICPKKMFAMDYLKYPPLSNSLLMKQVADKIKRADNKMQKLKNEKTKILLNNAEDLLFYGSITNYEFYRVFFYRQPEFFISVICNYQTLKPILTVNLLHFICWKISCPLTSHMSNIKLLLYIHSFTSTPNRTTEYTELKFNNKYIHSFKTIPQSRYEYNDGIYLYFVNPSESTFYSNFVVSALPNKETEIILDGQKINRISTERSPCSTIPVSYLVYNYLYENISSNILKFHDVGTCLQVELQNKLYNNFNCIIAQHLIPVHIPYDTKGCFNILDSEFNLTKFTYILFNYYYNVTLMQTITMECLRKYQCSYMEFMGYVNYFDWPLISNLKNFFKEMKLIINNNNRTIPGFTELFEDVDRHENNLPYWIKNFYKVSIRPKSVSVISYNESVMYEWTNFLSDCGGILGFYMGISVLTLCELLQLIHHYLLMVFTWIKKKKNVDKVKSENY